MGKHTVRAWFQKRRKRIIITLLGLLLFSSVAGAVGSVAAYQPLHEQYLQAEKTAYAGMAHLQNAAAQLKQFQQSPFDGSLLQRARQEFTLAYNDFYPLEAQLKGMPDPGTFIPYYGVRLHAAIHLIPIATIMAQSGENICDVINLFLVRFHHANSALSLHLSSQDFVWIGNKIHILKASIGPAVEELQSLSASDLSFDPRIAAVFEQLQNNLPQVQAWIVGLDELAPTLPALLGVDAPIHYLVELLDSTELRPGGGFIGNYGIATFSDGKLTSADITDVDLLDKPFYAAGHRIAYPPQYNWFSRYLATDSWSLRDSNLDADFPTAARYAETNYTREGGKVPVQGVIAITPTFIQHAISVVGPISVPEYHETITAQNLIERIHYYQLGAGAEGPDTIAAPDGHSSLRKHFTALLAEHFVDAVHHLAPAALLRLLHVVIDAVPARDLQFYFNAPPAEDALLRFHVAAAIQAAAGDSLFVVDANIGVNKANSAIQSVLNDQVSLDGNGNAVHHTTLTYIWQASGTTMYGRKLYRSYVRVYLPAQSRLQYQAGWNYQGSGKAFKRAFASGYYVLDQGQTHTITLTWLVPGATSQKDDHWHYQYTIQRQAGTQWLIHSQIDLPACNAILLAQSNVIRLSKDQVSLSRLLNKDQTITLDYQCGS